MFSMGARLIFPGGGDLAVELGACVQVMVVRRQPGLPQLARLLWRQHAQRRAHLSWGESVAEIGIEVEGSVSGLGSEPGEP